MRGRRPRGGEGGSRGAGRRPGLPLGFPSPLDPAHAGRRGGRGLGSLEAALARLRALLEDEGRHPLLVSTAGSKQPRDTWPDVCPVMLHVRWPEALVSLAPHGRRSQGTV